MTAQPYTEEELVVFRRDAEVGIATSGLTVMRRLLATIAERDLEITGLKNKIDDYPCCGKCDQGQALTRAAVLESEIDRLHEQARRSATVCPKDGCMLWKGHSEKHASASKVTVALAALEEKSDGR